MSKRTVVTDISAHDLVLENIVKTLEGKEFEDDCLEGLILDKYENGEYVFTTVGRFGAIEKRYTSEKLKNLRLIVYSK
jgi:hypothetical protein